MRFRYFILSAVVFAAFLVGAFSESSAGGLGAPLFPRLGSATSPYLHQIQISSCIWYQRDVWVPCTSYSGCITWAFCAVSNRSHRGCVCLAHGHRPMGIRQEGHSTVTIDPRRSCHARCTNERVRCVSAGGGGDCSPQYRRCLAGCPRPGS